MDFYEYVDVLNDTEKAEAHHVVKICGYCSESLAALQLAIIYCVRVFTYF